MDFSHGDVDAFPPPPGAFETFTAGVEEGTAQAYTPHKGRVAILDELAAILDDFTGAPVDPAQELIITPGSQGALFLAMAASVEPGSQVALVDPDYFANRKLIEFLDAVPVYVRLRYEDLSAPARLDLDELENAFRGGVGTFVFSNPNNPTGVVYPPEQVARIAQLARQYDVTLIVDELYSRLTYDGSEFAHARALSEAPPRIVTTLGPSKTESLSGYRLGVALGTAELVERMEKLQAIVSLRASGYSQAVLRTWFREPAGWLDKRIAAHCVIRDDLVNVFTNAGWHVRSAEGGTYIYPQLPELDVPLSDFVQLLRRHADVTVTPGSEFSPGEERRVRLNYSQDHVNSVEAARRMVEFASRYARG